MAAASPPNVPSDRMTTIDMVATKTSSSSRKGDDLYGSHLASGFTGLAPGNGYSPAGPAGVASGDGSAGVGSFRTAGAPVFDLFPGLHDDKEQAQ